MLEGLRLYKRDWAKVTQFVGTRSAAQVRSHAQKYFDKVAREKTDDYVPRARPKRKSSAPYPRKARDETDPANALHAHMAHQQQMAMAMPMRDLSAAPSVPPSVTQRRMPHPHPHAPMHVQIAQSPILSHVPSSPYLQQPQTIAVQQGVPQHMYSPMMNMCPTAPSPDPQAANMQPQPSPASYVTNHAYSPAPPPPHMVQQPPMYNVFSPMTPGSAYPGMRSPSIAHTPVSLVSPAMSHAYHVPTHTHSAGGGDNCAKCAALQRYGNVLQEIGGFNHPTVQQTFPQPPSMVQHQHQQQHVANPSRTMHAHQHPINGVPSAVHHEVKRRGGATSGISSGKKMSDVSSSLTAGDGKKRGSVNRALRSKVLKERRGKSKRSPQASVLNSTGSEDMSEEGHSMGNKSSEESVSQPSGRTLGNIAKKRVAEKRKSSGKRKSASYCSKERRDKAAALKRPRNESGTVRTSLGVSKVGKSSSPSFAKSVRKPAKEATGPIHRSASVESEAERSSSPAVETYSPKEQKEIFDAVHSLQILAKTSSSPSSSESNGKE